MGSQISLSSNSQVSHSSQSVVDMESPAGRAYMATPEKRQDNDCFPDYHSENNDAGRRSSPGSSPLAALKLRRIRLFPDENNNVDVDKNPRKSTTRTVQHRPLQDREEASSGSLASSMFLVSPLRPLGNRSRDYSAVETRGDPTNAYFKAALIDSSRAVLRPLTPPHLAHRDVHHGPKKRNSMSTRHLSLEEPSEPELETESRVSPPSSCRTLLLPPLRTKLEPTTITAESGPESNLTTTTPTKPRWLIPAEHPYKVLWDVMTFLLSFANVYVTHTFIRDRQFGNSWFVTVCEAWFMMDILLNFFTEYRSDSYALQDCRSVWARYLTTWFVVDVISLFPGEQIYVKPLFDIQKQRNFFQKNFFRSRAVVRVTRILRGRHLKMFGQAAKHTKHAGVGASRLLRLLIKYIPKYLLFFRNMKGVLVVRTLRQVHWFRKVWRNFIYKGLENETTETEEAKNPWVLRKNRPAYDEDEDGAPF